MCPATPVPRQDGLIYDVGMHQGEDTEFYLKKGFKVIGFEADPDLVRHCRDRFADEIGADRLVVVEGAIVDSALLAAGQKTVRFYKNTLVSVWGTLLDAWAQRNEMLGAASQIIEVKTVDFVDCLMHYGIPHYLKIDIEGSDTACLKVLDGFAVRPSYVSIEAEKVHFRQLEAEIDLLERLGYGEFKAVQQANVALQAPPNPPREGTYVFHKFSPESSGLFGRELPGRWKSRNQVLTQYRQIFLLYRLFGNYSLLRRSRAGQSLIKNLGRAFRTPIPGWYDTHARLSAADS